MSKSKRNFSRFNPFAKKEGRRSPRSSQRSFGPRFEALEARRVLSASATFQWDSLAATVTEGDDSGAGSLALLVNGTLTSPVTVGFAAVGGTGTASTPADFTLANIDIPAATYTNELFTLTETGALSTSVDGLTEGTEFFFVETFSTSVDLVFTGPTTATQNIADGESSSVSIADVTVGEDDGTGSAVVTLDTSFASLPEDLELTVTAADGSAGGDDYAVTTKTVTFSKGDLDGATATIDFDLTSDKLVEGDEDFTVDIAVTKGTASLDDGSATVTITDDDTVEFNIITADESVTEPAASTAKDVTIEMTFNTTGSVGDPALTSDLTVAIDSAGSTANASDFALSPVSATFSGKQTTATTTVTVFGDSLIESAETVNVNLGTITGALAGSASLGSDTNYQLTINDDDTATLDIVADTVAADEGDSGTSTRIFTISLSTAAGSDITVPIKSVTGTATAGSDYTAVTATDVTIKAGSTSTTLAVETSGDNTVEADETIIIEIDDPGVSGVSLGAASATTTLTNDDSSKVTILAPSSDIDEGTTGMFTVFLTKPSSQDTTVSFSISGGSASASDYSGLTPSPITVLAGTQLAMVDLTAELDSLVEGSETVDITINSAVSGSLDVTVDTIDTATATIADVDSATVELVSDSATVAEDGGSVTVIVELSGDVAAEFDVAFSTADGSASAGSDYTDTSGTVTFPANSKAGATQSITVPILEDTDVEGDEDFTINLDSTTNTSVTVGATGAATVTVDDNDEETVSISGVTIDESAGSAILTLTRSETTTLAGPDLKVDVATADGSATAGSDYTATSTTVSFPVSGNSTTVSIPITEDSLVEADESFTVSITGVPAGVQIATGLANVVIEDNDEALITVSGEGSVTEPGDDPGSTDVTFWFTTDKKASTPITVNYQTVDDTAIAADGDYTAVSSGVATIPADSWSTSVTVTVLDDALVEASEDFSLEITGVSTTGGKVSIGTTSSDTLTIDDDDSAKVSVSDLTVDPEGTGSDQLVDITITTDAPVQDKFTVDLGSLSNSDLSLEKTTIELDPLGGTVTSFNIADALKVIGDSIVEADEEFTIVVDTVTSSAGVSAGDSGKVTIVDDDSALLSISADTDADEDAGDRTFTISLSNPLSESLTVDFTVGGTATSGDDYYAHASTSAHFSAGQTAATVTFSGLTDSTVEADETITVTLTDPAVEGVSLGLASDTANIINDDTTEVFFGTSPWTVYISADAYPTGAAEPGTDETVMLSLTNPSDFPVIVGLDIDGTATNGDDYGPLSSVVNFAPGQTTAMVTIAVNDDTELEGSETVDLTIASAIGGATSNFANTASIGTPDNTVVTIEDDEVELVDILISGSDWNVGGYSLLDNTAETLPWVNLDTITVVTGEPATFEADDLTLSGLSGAYTLSFDGTNTWTIDGGPLDIDRLTLDLDGDVATSGVPLGGGDASVEFNTLPGDATGNGVVNVDDVFDVFLSNGSTNADPERRDLDGSGGVNVDDIFDAFLNNGDELPPPPSLLTIDGDEDEGDDGDSVASLIDNAFAGL